MNAAIARNANVSEEIEKVRNSANKKKEMQ
jgi:hypothetical protein